MPIYEASYRQQTPAYSASDLAYFGSLDDTGSSGSSGGGSFLEFSKPGETKTGPPPRRASKGDFSSGRPPRPAFKKKDKYGFKGRGRQLPEERPEREKPSRDRYDSRRAKEREKPKRPDKPKKREKEDAYLDFDDFD